MLCSSLPCWSSPRSGETSIMQSQAEKALTPNRQQLNNSIRKMLGMCIKMSPDCQQKFLKQIPLQIRRLPSAAISMYIGNTDKYSIKAFWPNFSLATYTSYAIIKETSHISLVLSDRKTSAN